ncbi:MAG: hypothetical protein AB7G93_11630 [Bdellovibrionales bacterium]
MNVKTMKFTEGELDKPAPPIVSSIEEDREVISSLCSVTPMQKRMEAGWSDTIQKSYSPTSHRRRGGGDQFSLSEYEDIFDYVLGMLEDTEALSFVESLYDSWTERGSLSERQHTSLMRFYNNLKRRYG